MADYSELKRLASEAKNWGGEVGEHRWYDSESFKQPYFSVPDAEFIAGCEPGAVLALIAENERLAEEYDKAWRHDLNDKANIEAMVGALAGAQAMLETACSEREQLKAEVEALRQDAERYRYLRTGAYSFVNSRAEVVAIEDMDAPAGDFADGADMLDAAVDAAMSKETGQ